MFDAKMIVNKLNIDTSEVTLDGMISSLSYSNSDSIKKNASRTNRENFQIKVITMNTFSQGQIFILFFILGLAISVFFDVFRALRKTFKTSDFITYLEDIVFMLVVGILIVNSLLLLNHGQIRFFILLALLFGITFYFLTISKICFLTFQILMKFCKKILFFPLFFKNKRLKKKDF